MKTTNEILRNAQDILEARKDRSAWSRGVTKFAVELLDTVRELGAIPEELTSATAIVKILLNGAEDWYQYSYGGSWMVYDSDIAQVLCTPSELKKTRYGERNPNSRETWLDVQARALRQAGKRASLAILDSVRA